MSHFSTAIADQVNKKLFLPAIRKVRIQEIEIKRREYTWGAPDYKLYPSGIKSWTACPKEYVKSQEKFGGIENIDGIYRTRRGTAIHREYQEDFVKSEFNAPEPKLTDERMIQKRKGNPCEVPFHDFETGFSGSVDACMLVRDYIIPVELKTTALDDYRWNDGVNKGFPERITQWTIQLCIYIYHLKKQGYYDYPIKDGRLVVLRYSTDAAELKSEFERQIKYSEFEEKTNKLMDAYASARSRYIQGKDIPCDYYLCKH